MHRVVTLIGALLWSGFYTKEGFFSDIPENTEAEGPLAGGPPPSRVFRQEIIPENASAWGRLWGTMVLRKWGNVYVKTSPTSGVVMLLIEKVYPGDAQSTEWTTVDGAKRVQIVNLRNRSVYTLRAQPGIKYSPMVALSSDDRKKTEQASWDVVRRAGGDTGDRHFSVVVGSTHRTRAIRSLLESIVSTGLLTMTYWTFGFWATGAFAIIKLAYFFRIPDTIHAALQAAKEMYDFVDRVSLFAADYKELHESGDLDLVYIAGAVGIMVIIYACMPEQPPPQASPRAPLYQGAESEATPPRSPRSPRVMGADISDAESTEEVDPRLRTLEENQNRILELLTRGQGAPPGLSPKGKTVHFDIASPAASRSSLDSDSELMSGVDRFISRLNAAEDVIGRDSAPSSSNQATAGSSTSPASPITSSSSWTSVAPATTSADSASPTVNAQIRRLELESLNPRDAAMEHLKRYQSLESFQIGGDAKVRLAPTFIAKLYRAGRPALREMEEYVRSKSLERCHAAAELPTLGLVLDRLVTGSSQNDVINMPAVEAICRRMYGLTRAFEDVTKESDWQKPRNHQGKWKTKVKWQLL